MKAVHSEGKSRDLESFRCSRRRLRHAGRFEGLPKWGEYPIGLALLRRNCPRLSDQGGIETLDLDPPTGQRCFKTFASRPRPGLITAVPVHGVRAGLNQQLVEYDFSRSTPQHQRVASLPQTVVQSPERSVKPPAGSAPRDPFAGVDIIENENGHYRAAAGDRRR
jgi:hypothetical protein